MKTLFKLIIGILLLLTCGFVGCVFLYFTFGKPWDRGLFMAPLYQLDTDEKVLALTFDDGPSPERTPALLDLLDKYDIKATFFLVGHNIEAYPEIAKAIVARGHLAGNHSYSHRRMIFKSPWFVYNEVVKTNKLLQDIGSDSWFYFRPPNTKKLIILPLVLKSLDMTLVTGSYDPSSQYEIPLSAEKVSSQVIANAEPGAVVYLHDGRSDSVDEFIAAVETIIIKLREDGYSFVTLDYQAH